MKSESQIRERLLSAQEEERNLEQWRKDAEERRARSVLNFGTNSGELDHVLFMLADTKREIKLLKWILS